MPGPASEWVCTLERDEKDAFFDARVRARPSAFVRRARARAAEAFVRRATYWVRTALSDAAAPAHAPCELALATAPTISSAPPSAAPSDSPPPEAAATVGVGGEMGSFERRACDGRFGPGERPVSPFGEPTR